MNDIMFHKMIMHMIIVTNVFNSHFRDTKCHIIQIISMSSIYFGLDDTCNAKITKMTLRNRLRMLKRYARN